MAGHGEQPEGEVLRADRSGPEEAAKRNPRVGNAKRRNHAHSGSEARRTAMSWFKVVANGLRSLFGRRQMERDLDEELRGYADAAVQDKIREGMARTKAVRQARLEMGSVDSLKQDVRDVGWESTLESFWQDVRFGARMLRKNPGFTAIAVAALALGIGANTAMFSVIEAVLLRPLPYSDAQRIMRVVSTWNRGGTMTSYTSSPPDFFDWRDQNRTFSSMFAFYRGESALTGRGDARRVRV